MDPCKKRENPVTEPDTKPTRHVPSLSRLSNHFLVMLQYGTLNTCLIEAPLGLNGEWDSRARFRQHPGSEQSTECSEAAKERKPRGVRDMYRFGRSIYRELAPRVMEDEWDTTGCRNKQQVLDSCEGAIQRLTYDRRYFARPARSLFNEIRPYFSIRDQLLVWKVV